MNKQNYIFLLIVLSMFTTINRSFGQSKMIWSEYSGKISQSNLDGSEKVVIHALHVPYDLQADTTNQIIYWSENGTKSIWKYYIALDSMVKIFQANENLRGITLNQDKLYFILESGIYKMNFDGSQVESVLAVSEATDVAVVDEKLYWCDLFGGKIWTRNAAGTGNITLFSNLNNPTKLDYNPSDMKLYWMEYCGGGNCSGVRKGNTSGGTKQVVINELISGYVLSTAGDKVFCTYDIFDEIFSVTINGTNRTTVLDVTSSPRNVVVVGDRLYWFDFSYRNYLYSNNFAGTNPKVVASSPVYNTTRFVIDSVEKWMYWVNRSGSFQSDNSESILRSRLDGSSVQQLQGSNQLDEPFGIGLDVVNQKLYWTGSGNEIKRSNTNGTGVETILYDDGSFAEAGDIVVDGANHRMFWTDSKNGKIQQSDLNGTQIITLADGIANPRSLYYEPTAGDIYFAEFAGGKTIQKITLSSGERDTIVTITDASQKVNAIWVDSSEGFLYWTDGAKNQINRMALDGSNNTTLLTTANGISNPTGIQVFPANVIVSTTFPVPQKCVVFPNPFSTSFTLTNVAEGDHVTLVDMVGRIVKMQVANGTDALQMDAAGLSNGMYWLVVQRKNGQKMAQKLVKMQ